MPELLLEIFSEEIPARMQGQAARDLARLFGERLSAAGLQAEGLRTFAGPRRLTLVCELPAATPDLTEEIKGPKASAPPQALEGFLRKTGLSREQLVERDGVLFATIERPGRATAEIVAEAVDAVIRAFPWPKSMRWGDGTLRWVRPIKRILCLFDGAVVPFVVADGSPDLAGRVQGIESGDATEGHRFAGTGRPLKIRDFKDYQSQLEADGVVLDVEERKRRILERVEALCAAEGLRLVRDEGLLEEVAGLSEWPVPILGEMDPAFLDLPPEVIRTSMRTHQKYFAVAVETVEKLVGSDANRSNGDEAVGSVERLAPRFLTVANIEPSDGGAAVAAGNARVLSARLNDARFFWDEDRKEGAFGRWLEKLRGVTFHAKLGTMAERVERIAALAREIAPLVGADPALAELAARLSKADLASGLVGEFPELQGVMGGYYVRALERPPFESGADTNMAGSGSAPFPLDGGRVGDGGGAGSGLGGGVATASVETSPEAAPPPLPASPPSRGRGEPSSARSPGDGEPRADDAWWLSVRDEVADAVRDHYRPQGPNDAVPTAPLTVTVALADKLDTLVGFFAIDEKPTGSKDPYALRRAALGVIRLLVQNGVRTSLQPAITYILAGLRIDRLLKVFDEAKDHPLREHAEKASAYFESYELASEGLAYGKRLLLAEGFSLRDARVLTIADLSSVEPVLAFFADRLKVLLRDQGQRHDLVDAVFALGDDDLVRIVARVRALEAFLSTEDGANLLAGYRRAANILKAEAKKNPGEAYEGDLEATLMSAPEERELSAALSAASLELTPRLEAEDFEGAMGVLARLRGPVDAFFDKVLVNDPDPAVRLNRLRLLSRVGAETGRVADFSAIVGS